MSGSAIAEEIDDHLAESERFLGRAKLEAGYAKELRDRHAAICARREDPSLYLAVLGEFSSGKSSLINALLRQRLLQTSALVSTCVLTELRAGPRLGIDIEFTDGDRLTLPAERERLTQKVAQLGVAPPADEVSLLRTLTSDQHLSPHIGKVRIHHPGPLLEHDVVVLDTPGISSEHPEHTARAESVADTADLFVVVIPSLSPLSDAFRTFLTEKLEAHLHRAIFVLTKMGHVDPEEHDSLVAFVQRRLRTDLSIEDPAVFPVSIPAVLDRLADDEPAQDSDFWQARFEALEAHLDNRLKRERALAVSERLTSLLERLMTDMKDGLEGRAADLREQAAVLEQNPVQDLRAFAADQRARGKERVKAVVAGQSREARKQVQERRKKALKEISGALDESPNAVALNAAATSGAEDVLKRSQKRLREDARKCTRAIADEATAILNDFDDAFESQYRTLERLAGTTVAANRASAGDLLKTGSALASVRALHATFDSKENKRAAGGAAAGAALGTLFLPVVGTLVGGGLGALASFLFGPTLDEQRREFRARLVPALDAAFAAAETQIVKVVNAQAASARRAIDARVKLYERQYEELITRMAAEHAAQSKRLANERRRTEADITAIASQLDDLRALARRLRGSESDVRRS